MTVRELIQELLLNSSLDDEVVISYQKEDEDYLFQTVNIVVKYDDEDQVGIVGRRD